MKKTLLLILFLALNQINAQTVLFEDSFETYDDFIIENIGSWTLNDVDLLPTYGFQGVAFTNSGVAKSFQIFNSTTTDPVLTASETSDWSARTGSKVTVCFAAMPAPPITANNDWLISPQITLGSQNNVLKFWAKSCDTGFGNEKFKVGISTTNTDLASFTTISPGNFVLNPATALWVEYTYNLDNYQGQSVYIAINCVSDDQFGFAIDDFSVTTGTLSTEDFFANNFSIYPNPTSDILNLKSNSLNIQNVQITDLNGRSLISVNYDSTTTTQLEVSSLSNGIYILNVTTDSGTGTSKFVKN